MWVQNAFQNIIRGLTFECLILFGNNYYLYTTFKPPLVAVRYNITLR